MLYIRNKSNVLLGGVDRSYRDTSSMSSKRSRLVLVLCGCILICGAVCFYVSHLVQPPPKKHSLQSFLTGAGSAAKHKNHPRQTELTKGADERNNPLSKTTTNYREVLLDSADCFLPGTVPGLDDKMCVCREGWNGAECSIPDVVWSSKSFQVWYSMGLIKRRQKPRRIINGLVFNHELDLLEIRVNYLGEAVDKYVIVESNYTYFGTAKPLNLRSNLSAGFLRSHTHKIIPVAITVYNYGNGDPWAPENYFRTSIWRVGQKRIRNLRDDDLFWISDADEIPDRDVLTFLKHHDGYGEPVALRLRWFLYGFFWEEYEPADVAGVCSVAYMRRMYANDSRRLRMMTKVDYSPLQAGTTQEWWTVTGTEPRYAGWHCSWCFDAHGIQVDPLEPQLARVPTRCL